MLVNLTFFDPICSFLIHSFCICIFMIWYCTSDMLHIDKSKVYKFVKFILTWPYMENVCYGKRHAIIGRMEQNRHNMQVNDNIFFVSRILFLEKILRFNWNMKRWMYINVVPVWWMRFFCNIIPIVLYNKVNFYCK